MSEASDAREVLLRARKEIIHEIVVSGSQGGTGRVNSYTPQLVSLDLGIKALDAMIRAELPVEVSKDHMAAMREARAAKSNK
jgi:hypothetical protein